MTNQSDTNIKTPTDILKKDFPDYLSELTEDIEQNVKFGYPLIKTIPQNVKNMAVGQELLKRGNNIYQYKVDCTKSGKWKITISKLINASIKKIKPTILISNNKSVVPNTANIQLLFVMDNGKTSEPVILSNKAKSNYKDFNLAVNQSNNRIITKLDDTSFTLLMEDLNKQEQETVLTFTNAGRVNYKGINGRLYQNGYLDNGEIIPANEYNEVKVGTKTLALDTSRLSHLPKIYLGEYDTKTELYNLLLQTEKIYKGRIEPFLCLGASILCVYLEEIWGNLTGFPVIYLQGNTKQGKSLIQGVVANIYGYNKKQMSMGNSTDNAIALKCSTTNSTPIVINDYDMFKTQSTGFENNVVHFYETGIREKLFNGSDFNLQPISSTAIYSSNYMPCIKEKIFNRLLPLYFPDNGIDTSEITNSYTNDTRRSKILAEVQKFGWDKVQTLIEGIEQKIISWEVFPNKDRESNNVSIAFTGLFLLESISGYTLPNRNKLIYEYCQWYQNLLEKSETPVDSFLNALPTLFHAKVLKQKVHFKLRLKEGRIIFIFDTQECIKLFNSHVAQTGAYHLTLNEKTFCKDLQASKYYISRTTVKYMHKQASSTSLDITDSANGKCFYSAVTQKCDTVFSDIAYTGKEIT